MKIKNFCASMDTINRVEIQPIEKDIHYEISAKNYYLTHLCKSLSIGCCFS